MMAQNAEFGRAVVRPLLLVVFIFCQFFFIAIPRHDVLDVEVWPNKQPSPRITQTRMISQSFICRVDNLSRIDIFFGTYNESLNSDLIFHLYQGSPKETRVAEVRIPGTQIKNNLFTPIEFPSIKKSRGKIFTFVLSMPAASKGKGPSVWMGAGDVYAQGKSFVRGRPLQGDCVFRTYSRRTVLAEWERISRGLPGVLRNPFILALAALLFEIAAVALFWRVLGFFFADGDAPDA